MRGVITWHTIDMIDKRQELKECLLWTFEICHKHLVQIKETLCGLKSYCPLDEKRYLNSDTVMRLDQFIFRFSKSQDAMSMRDVLDRLERLGVIDSVESWVYMRELKNTVVHDYLLYSRGRAFIE